MHGSKFEVEIDDESLFHLDMALGLLNTDGTAARIHTLTRGLIVSFPSEAVVLVYENAPHLKVDETLLGIILDKARTDGTLTVPFLTVPFERGNSEVLP
tara:strand:+ start:16550 stop:16846 length:297 start_codon:yes stop_codon:yes gene_type:complete